MTRTVLLVGRWAVKFPGGLKGGRAMFWAYPLRGWLANRSEWRQRNRADVARPVATIGHLALIMPRADRIANEDDCYPAAALYHDDADSDDRDEQKPSSWGWFACRSKSHAVGSCASGRWLLVDFDRAWHQEDRGLVGWLYYGRQERLARKWMALP